MAIKKNFNKQITPVYNQILIRPMVRTVNDVGNWRSALKLADMGNRAKLYDLYEDILIDGILTDAIDKRIDAVKDADLSFTVKNKDIDLMYDLIDSIEFEDMLGEIMWSKFWGITVDEFSFLPDWNFNFESIPRKHIRPKFKEIAKRQEDERGISYADNENIIQFGKDDDLGLLHKIAPLVIYKRGGFGDWSQFVEMFGMPMRIGKYSSMDEASRRELIQAFETAGSSPYLVIPKETEATQTVNASAGNGVLYNDFRLACTEEILISVLGQTMTTVDGSSLAQGKVHMEVQEKKHRADRRFVERMLNRYFVPLLIKRGYPIQGGKFQFLDNKSELEVTEIVQLADIMPIPQSYLHERFNIPLPQNDEPIARREAQPQYEIVNNPTVDEEVKNQDRSLWERMQRFFGQAQQDWASGTLTLSDETLSDRLIKQVVAEKGKAYFSEELFRFTNERLLEGIKRGFRNKTKLADTSFVYGASDDAYMTAMEQNLFRFSAAKTLAEMQELNRHFRESTSFNDFHKKAEETTDVFNKTWLETEYDTAVLTSESASTYRRLIEQTNIFPYWEYKTIGDDQVRAEHRRLNGLILPADDPRWRKIMPPNGWNCRCYIVPRMAFEAKDTDLAKMREVCDQYLASLEWNACEKQGFGINRALEGEVFVENQMYIDKFQEQPSKVLEKITPQEWGVKESVNSLMREATEEAATYEGAASDWFTQNKTIADGKELLQVKDYKSRTWSMTKKGFETITSEKETGKWLNQIQQVASDPDEVWLSRERKNKAANIKAINNYTMIRYFKNVVLVLTGKLDKKELILHSFYVLKNKYVRRGLLLKRK